MNYRLLPRALWSLLGVFLVPGRLCGFFAAVERKSKLEALDLVIDPAIGLLLSALEGLVYLPSSNLPAIEWFPAALLIQMFLLIDTENVIVGSVAAQGLLRAKLLFEVGRCGVLVNHLLILLLLGPNTNKLFDYLQDTRIVLNFMRTLFNFHKW